MAALDPPAAAAGAAPAPAAGAAQAAAAPAAPWTPPPELAPADFTIVWTRPEYYQNGEALPVYINNANNNQIEIPVAVRTTDLDTYNNQHGNNNRIRNEPFDTFRAAHPDGRYIIFVDGHHFQYLPTQVINNLLALSPEHQHRKQVQLSASRARLDGRQRARKDKRVRRFHGLNSICFLDPRFFADGQVLPLLIRGAHRVVPMAVNNEVGLPANVVAHVRGVAIDIKNFWPLCDK